MLFFNSNVWILDWIIFCLIWLLDIHNVHLNSNIFLFQTLHSKSHGVLGFWGARDREFTGSMGPISFLSSKGRYRGLDSQESKLKMPQGPSQGD